MRRHVRYSTDVTGTPRAIHDRLAAQAAAELAAAERDALAAGKERFDLATLERLLQRGPQAAREQGHREAYYISFREVKTLAEYVARVRAIEPYEDSR
jgi:hypothetical protein